MKQQALISWLKKVFPEETFGLVVILPEQDRRIELEGCRLVGDKIEIVAG